jgi:osmoprotectant transport system substrate-binding protein
MTVSRHDKAYGLNVPKASMEMLDTGVIYKTTAKGGTCNFGEVFATDGSIAALKLKVLAVDMRLLPQLQRCPHPQPVALGLIT